MKKTLQLKWLVLIIALSLTAVLIFGYSMLSGRYFFLGMDNVTAGNMEQTIHKYHDSISLEQRKLANRFEGYPITSLWQQQPENIQRVFNETPENTAELYKVENINKKTDDKGVFFAMRWQIDDQTYFISHHLTRATVSKMVHDNIKRSRDSLNMIALISISLFALIFWIIMRRVSLPVAALNKWTRELTPDTLNQPIPDFSYSELNDQAKLIRNSLSSVQAGLEREQKFLRHTSHELRTPISVIRSNIDLLHKLNEKQQVAEDPRQKEIFDRIDRASLTMKNMTETLLWLSRDEKEKLPQQEVQLDQLVKQLIEESRYLLSNKPVKLIVETEPASIKLPEVAARILISNLIRNAFQHTTEGKVYISQHDHNIQIDNYNILNDNSAVDNNADLGFGLGLQLTEQLTQHLGWEYENNSQPAGHQTSITFI